DVLERPEWMLLRQGLDIEDIDRGSSDRSGAQTPNEGVLVDDRTARRVYQPRRGLHEYKVGGADEAAGPMAQDYVDGQDVRLPKQLVLRHHRGAHPRGCFRHQVLAPGDDLHAECEPDARDLAADIPET